jgi:hypothetical protein
MSAGELEVAANARDPTAPIESRELSRRRTSKELKSVDGGDFPSRWQAETVATS